MKKSPLWRKSQIALCILSIHLWSFQALANSLYPGVSEVKIAESRQLEDSVSNTIISPRWLADGEAFWYRRNSGTSSFEFVFVDVAKGISRTAFDHEKLAEKLSREIGNEVNPHFLPFSWIDPSADGLTVRFRIDNRKWQFSADGSLTEWSGDTKDAKLHKFRRAVPSVSGGESTSMALTNQTETPLSLYWIDVEGKEHGNGTVEIETSFKPQTYVGHVWSLTEPTSGRVVGVYRATENDQVAIIGNSNFDGAVVDGDSLIPKGKQLGLTSSKETPDSKQPAKYTAFVREYNVWARDPDGEETKISSNGSKDHPYSIRIHHSTDGTHAVVWQYRPAQDHSVTLVESSPKDQVQPKLKTIQYLKPGDRVRVDRPRIFDLEGKREVTTDDGLFKNPYSIENVGWNEDGSEYRFLFNERGHQNLRMIGMNREGSVRAIVDESSKTFIDYSSKTYWREIKDTNELLWASERDGYNHLYLYDTKTGEVKNQITKGEWMMRAVVQVDESTRRIWFRAFGIVPGQDPYYAHLARINFNGTGLTILTEGDGTHTWKWSPGQKYLVDTWSRVDSPSQTVVRDAETGKEVTGVEPSGIKAIDQPAAQYAERFSAPGRDGKTMIYGIIIKPANFDSKKKYPVIEQIYAGPQDFFTPKSFSPLTRQRVFADLGFILVQIDGMGTNWRGKTFHDVCYKNLKDGGFLDRKAWMKAAAETRPWMDISKVGIYGGSAGGQNAMAAMLFHSDFYKAGVADSGCHDNRMDKLWWNEQFMGYPVDKSYENSSNVVHAGKLTGALMLMVGELDTNVDPASTLQVVNALIKAGKDFDLVFVPGGEHGAGSGSYGLRRQRDFFQKHLQGIEHGNRNKA